MRALNPSRKSQSARWLAGAAIALTIFLSPGASAADLSKADIQSLDKLEKRFFEQTYPKDTPEARIERLEKLIFGEAHQGDQEERMQTLMASLPNEQLPADPGTGNSGSSNAGSGQSDSGDDNQQSQQTADNSAGDNSDYPKVDAIEQLLLGKTFKGEPLSKRLDQLEIKAFKSASTNPDLSERVSKLDEYVQKHMHKSVDELVDPRNVYHYSSPDDGDNVRAPAYAEGPGGSRYGAPGGVYGGGGAQTSYGGGSGSYGMNPPQPAYQGGGQQDYWAAPSAAAPDAMRVGWLEQHVYGSQSNPSVPLIDRLKRLESTVFPTEPVDPNTSLQGQIAVLVNAVELMHSSNPASPTVAGQTGMQAPASTGAAGAAGSNFPSWPPQVSSQPQAQSSQYAAGGYGTSQYGAGGQYGGNYSAGGQQSSYPYINSPGNESSYSGQVDQNQINSQTSATTAQTQPDENQKHGHPLLKGLAQSLMTVGTMAAGAMVMNKMSTGSWSGRGYGGYGNYGNYGGYGGYGYGGYGGGFMPGYSVPGIGGLGGLHF